MPKPCPGEFRRHVPELPAVYGCTHHNRTDPTLNQAVVVVTSVDTSHDKDGNVIPTVGVNAILSKPVEYVEMKVSV